MPRDEVWTVIRYRHSCVYLDLCLSVFDCCLTCGDVREENAESAGKVKTRYRSVISRHILPSYPPHSLFSLRSHFYLDVICVNYPHPLFPFFLCCQFIRICVLCCCFFFLNSVFVVCKWESAIY